MEEMKGEDRPYTSISGDWFRWLAKQPPYRRLLTQEECHILARSADALR